MRIQVNLFLIIVIFLSAGCVSKTEIHPTGLPAKEATTLHPTLASMITLTVTPSSTSVPTHVTPGPATSDTPVHTDTQTALYTPTHTPDSGVIQDCLIIQPNWPAGYEYNGTIAFEAALPGYGGIFLYDMQERELTRITGNGYDLSISPDRTLFAYQGDPINQLEIFSVDGEQIKSLPWREEWRFNERWLDDQNILIPLIEELEPTGDLKFPPDVLLLNPFTDNSKTLLSDYPDIDTDSTTPGWPWQRSSGTIYSPDLNRVVYPGAVYPESEDINLGYILYDVPGKRKLAQVPNIYWVGYPPVWSPDGSKFIMLGTDEFYLVDYDGAISKVTHMNPDFDKGTGLRYLAKYYSWSPDNQHVAFWLSPFGSTNQYTLAVLDTYSGEITDYCIPAGGDNLYEYGGGKIYPVWSPDGKNLVVAANFSPEGDSNDVILVDLEKTAAFTIASNNLPYGWLVSP